MLIYQRVTNPFHGRSPGSMAEWRIFGELSAEIEIRGRQAAVVRAFESPGDLYRFDNGARDKQKTGGIPSGKLTWRPWQSSGLED